MEPQMSQHRRAICINAKAVYWDREESTRPRNLSSLHDRLPTLSKATVVIEPEMPKIDAEVLFRVAPTCPRDTEETPEE